MKYRGVQLLQSLQEQYPEAVRFGVNRILTGFRHLLDRNTPSYRERLRQKGWRPAKARGAGTM